MWVFIFLLAKVQCVLLGLPLGYKSPYVPPRACWLWALDAHWTASGPPGVGNSEGCNEGGPLRGQLLEPPGHLAPLMSVTFLRAPSGLSEKMAGLSPRQTHRGDLCNHCY